VNNDILNLTNLGTTSSDEIPEPGTPENPWIGIDRVVRGQKTFYAFSGAERRRLRRQQERDDRNERERGQRAYNRQQRQQAFDADTVRQQARILTGEIEASFDMQNNLTAHIMRQTRLNERAQNEPERKAASAERRRARLNLRRTARIDAGKPRHADLVFAGERTA
jgi:hypothetical protein